MNRSTLVSRNIVVAGKRTTVRMEHELWQALTAICEKDGTTINQVCTAVEKSRPGGTTFTSALRVYIITRVRRA